MNNTRFFSSRLSNLKLDSMIIFRLNSTPTLRFLKSNNFVHAQAILHKRQFRKHKFYKQQSSNNIPFEVVSHHIRPKKNSENSLRLGLFLN